jgi:hypothetical protein
MSSVNLNDNEWGQLMSILADAPWKIANPLLMKIGDQLRAEAMINTAPTSNKAPTPEEIRMSGNSQEVRDGQ